MHYHAYRQQRDSGLSRIDLILEVYDGILRLLDQAQTVAPREAVSLRTRCQLALSAVASGMVGAEDDVAVNFLRLYEYAAHCLQAGTPDKIRDAHTVLTTLRDGFLSVREEAIRLERAGEIPALSGAPTLQAIA